MNNEMTFKEIAGMWQRVDSQEPHPQTLAETLNELGIIIDDNAQFSRIIKYYDNYYNIITYRSYNRAKVTITISVHYYD